MISMALEAPTADNFIARRRAATVAILMALVVAAFEGTVVTTAMPTITTKLDGASLYAWVFAAFLLASTVGVLVFGRLADAVGRRPVFLVGMTLFLSGSLLCGLATTMAQLVAFRVLQGVGAGALQPIAMTISADLYSLEERARVQAAFTTVWGMASLVGPIVGAAIVTHTSWRWVFLVNVPFGLASAVTLQLTYRDPPRRNVAVDGVGGALLAGTSAALALFALDRAGLLDVSMRLGAGVTALTLAVLFVNQQRRSTSPLLPLAMLDDPAVRAGTVASIFVGAFLYTATAYVPLWLTHERHLTAFTAGSALTTLLVGWAMGSSVGVRVLVRWGMRASVGGGLTIASVGVAVLALVARLDLPTPLAIGGLFFAGIGLGPSASTSLVACQSRAPWRSRGMMTSVIYATRSLGGALLVSALGGAVGTSGAGRFTAMAAILIVGAILLLTMAPGRIEARTD